MSKKKKALKEALKEIDKCEKVLDSGDSTVRGMIHASFKAIKAVNKALRSI